MGNLMEDSEMYQKMMEHIYTQMDMDDRQLAEDCRDDLMEVMKNYGETISLVGFGLFITEVVKILEDKR